MAIANMVTRGGPSVSPKAAIAFIVTHGLGSYGGPTPPPTTTAYVKGASMVQQGTSILLQGTAPLINKGTVRDQLNVIPH